MVGNGRVDMEEAHQEGDALPPLAVIGITGLRYDCQ